ALAAREPCAHHQHVVLAERRRGQDRLVVRQRRVDARARLQRLVNQRRALVETVVRSGQQQYLRHGLLLGSVEYTAGGCPARAAGRAAGGAQWATEPSSWRWPPTLCGR